MKMKSMKITINENKSYKQYFDIKTKWNAKIEQN